VFLKVSVSTTNETKSRNSHFSFALPKTLNLDTSYHCDLCLSITGSHIAACGLWSLCIECSSFPTSFCDRVLVRYTLYFVPIPTSFNAGHSNPFMLSLNFKAHFSLSFATVSHAVVSLYFKCALRYFPTATRLSVTVSFSLVSSFSGISVYSHYVG
jgi:hypothetical protein